MRLMKMWLNSKILLWISKDKKKKKMKRKKNSYVNYNKGYNLMKNIQ